MRLIDADKLCEDLLNRWSMADSRKEELIRQVMADIVTPIVISQPTIEPDWTEMVVICDNCGHAIHVKRIDVKPTIEPQKWVSCSERLPEEKKEVLVSADGDLYIAILETINGELSWSEVIEYRYIMGVDAWMPLPEPWGGDSDD